MLPTAQPTRHRWLVLATVLSLAYWFFGNLYEAVVFSPNWVHDSPAQLARMNALFVHTSPTVYFVPVTQLATVAVWLLWARNRDPQLRPGLRRAALFALLATIVNVVIVSTLIPHLFGPDFLADPGGLSTYAWWWNGLNLVRMGLVAASAAHLFGTFRVLDRRRP